MVIDSSALVAIVFFEEEAEVFARAISSDGMPMVSAATHLEVGILLLNRSESTLPIYKQMIVDAKIQIVPVDEEQANIAIEAARFFGKGRHPAGLNYGDCFSYALAKQTGEPLLFKGNDFTKTDVARVL